MQKHLGTSWSPVFSSGENSERFSREDLGIALHGDPHVLICYKLCMVEKERKANRNRVRDEWGNFQTRVWCWLTQWKPDSWQLLKIGFWVAKGPLTNPVVVFHTLCDRVASICNLAHCHASFGREEYGRVWGDWACYWKSFFVIVYLHLFMLWAKPLFKKLILTFNILFHIIIFVMNSYLDVNIKIFLFL